MKTEDLYVVYVLSRRRLLDLDAFWEKLFTTDGLFDRLEYWAALASDKNTGS